MPALGQRFRAAREARGLSLPEVAEQIRIRSVYLAAIEEENWNKIGAPVYVRGFLRTYARFLGLDAEEAVAAFNLREGEGGAIVPSQGWVVDSERAGGRRTAQLSPLIWIASLVAVVLVGFVVYNELTLPKHIAPTSVAGVESSPTSLAASAAPSTTPSASASPAASPSPLASPSPGASSLFGALALPSGSSLGDSAHALTLRLSALCWLRVVVDGNVRIEGTFAAGTIKTFYGRSAIVRAGNAGAADVIVDGKDLGKMGVPGAVVERSFIL